LISHDWKVPGQTGSQDSIEKATDLLNIGQSVNELVPGAGMIIFDLQDLKLVIANQDILLFDKEHKELVVVNEKREEFFSRPAP